MKKGNGKVRKKGRRGYKEEENIQRRKRKIKMKRKEKRKNRRRKGKSVKKGNRDGYRK